jgi:hypothetical protein
MKFSLKSMAFGIALAVGASGALTTAPAAAQTDVYLGIGTRVGGPGYYDAGYRSDYRGDRGYRGGGYGYRGDGYRGDGYRDRRGWRGNRWQGGYRERCWTEWRRTRYDRIPVRICR